MVLTVFTLGKRENSVASEPSGRSNLVSLPTAATKSLALPGRRVVIPAAIIIGYVTMIISGFGTRLGSFQSLALYLYCSLLLLYFQAYISITRTAWWLVYIFLSSAFVVLYAAEVLYNSSTDNFTRSPYTYIIINVLLVIVFFVGAVSDRSATVSYSSDAAKSKPEAAIVKEASSVDVGSVKPAGGGNVTVLTPRRTPTSFSTSLAARAAGLAILLYISAFFLDTMNQQSVLHSFHLGLPFLRPPYVTVDLNTLFGLHLPANLHLLEGFDLIFALLATAIALLGMVMVGALEVGPAFMNAPFQVLRRSILEGWKVVRPSLQLVLGPLVWLIPAFSAGIFSQQVVHYLNLSASLPNTTLIDLVNPLSVASRANFGEGIVDVVLGAVALLAVIVAVLFVESDREVLNKTLRVFKDLGLIIAVTLAFFLYSLALLNVVAVLASVTKSEPFQVGVPGLLALIAAVGFSIYVALRSRKKWS
jgi:hypothetical protein